MVLPFSAQGFHRLGQLQVLLSTAQSWYIVLSRNRKGFHPVISHHMLCRRKSPVELSFIFLQCPSSFWLAFAVEMACS